MTSQDPSVDDIHPLGLKDATPKQISKNFRVIFRDIICYLEMNSDRFPMSKTMTRELFRKQACAIAAVKTCKRYVDFKKSVDHPPASISGSTFTRYKQAAMEDENSTLSYEELLSKPGRPSLYHPFVDSLFLDHVDSDETPTIEKTTPEMVEKYKQLHCQVFGQEEEKVLTNEGVRKHIRQLLKRNNFVMRTAKVVDAKRCIGFEVLDAWYHDRLINAALRNKHPRLIFNADETEINRKHSFKCKVACKGVRQPRVAARDRSGSHVSMFIMVSASGSVVEPSFLLHGGPESYVSEPSLFEDKIKCIKTSNGYMEKWAFKKIMKEDFVPYVNRLRESMGLESDERAALVVDGHVSRYDIETFQLLNEACIDLIILPAHSSHITQPLDITLNGLVKRAFPALFRKGVPQTVLDDMEMLTEMKKRSAKPARAPKRRRVDPVDSETDVISSSAQDAAQTASASKKKIGWKPVKKDERNARKSPSYAAMERLCTLWAIMNAMKVLTPNVIISSWRATGLHPFNGVPPITKKSSDEMLREMHVCENLGVEPRPRSKDSITITGVVNNDEGIERFKQLLAHKELKPRRYAGKYSCLTSVENSVNRIDIVNGNEDVGDYVDLDNGDTEHNDNAVFGSSDANCYVARDRRTRRFIRLPHKAFFFKHPVFKASTKAFRKMVYSY